MENSSRSALVAGRVSVETIMQELSRDRPVFHSEADFQHAFARSLWELDPLVQSRLEVRQGNGREYLDLLCNSPVGRTAIEFKYFSRRWSGTHGDPAEEYNLKEHAATDLLRRDFVFDLARVERFTTHPDTTGLVILLTNDPSIWSTPRTNRSTRDSDFRLHEGRTLKGELLWGGGDYPANTRDLVGKYYLGWNDYSTLPGTNGQFRYLVVAVYLPKRA
ncbi:hypothetical protein K0651_03970 [Ornithinimicrobium sp. Arc0846-15]|nr:hypothetical protein [Ornithinimicrobium laminariae]